MQVETLRDVLHWTGEFHRHLTECMVHCAGNSENVRSQLLLNYLSEHEKKLAYVVREFEQMGNEHALNTWCYEYLDKHPIIHHEYCDAPFSELSSREIMEVIIHQHKQVIDLYRYLRGERIFRQHRN